MSKTPKILIVGAGAVGGYFGALLCRAGADVTFLVRATTYAAIQSHGLTIKSINGDFTVYPMLVPMLVQAAPALPKVDFIFLAVKCYDLVSVLDQIAPWVKKGAVVLTLQNGVTAEEKVLDYFKEDCLVAGVAYITARLARPGCVDHYRRGEITIGELSGEKSDRVTKICDLLHEAGITCHVTSRISQTKWKKLCWNATFNPLSVILDAPISLILDQPYLLGVVRSGIQEVINVAAAEGFFIDAKIIEETIATSDLFRDYATSMYEDYKHGKPTEIEEINGDLIRRGKKWGIPTPTHEILYALVLGLTGRGATLHRGHER